MQLAVMSQVTFTTCGWQVGCESHLAFQGLLSKEVPAQFVQEERREIEVQPPFSPVWPVGRPGWGLGDFCCCHSHCQWVPPFSPGDIVCCVPMTPHVGQAERDSGALSHISS